MIENLEVKLVDSFVLNKLGEGHGESRLYLGGYSNLKIINNIFQTKADSKITLKFFKSNILDTLSFFEPFYRNPKKFYLSNGKLHGFSKDLPKLYGIIQEILKNSSEEIFESGELLSADKKGRSYLRVEKNSLLRKFFLPHSVKVIFSRNASIIDAQVLCDIKPELIPIKKDIKVNNQKLSLEFDYFSNYEY